MANLIGNGWGTPGDNPTKARQKLSPKAAEGHRRGSKLPWLKMKLHRSNPSWSVSHTIICFLSAAMPGSFWSSSFLRRESCVSRQSIPAKAGSKWLQWREEQRKRKIQGSLLAVTAGCWALISWDAMMIWAIPDFHQNNVHHRSLSIFWRVNNGQFIVDDGQSIVHFWSIIYKRQTPARLPLMATGLMNGDWNSLKTWQWLAHHKLSLSLKGKGKGKDGKGEAEPRPTGSQHWNICVLQILASLSVAGLRAETSVCLGACTWHPTLQIHDGPGSQLLGHAKFAGPGGFDNSFVPTASGFGKMASPMCLGVLLLTGSSRCWQRKTGMLDDHRWHRYFQETTAY